MYCGIYGALVARYVCRLWLVFQLFGGGGDMWTD